MPPLEPPKEPEGDPLDDGFWFPREYVITTWLEHERHGTYPNGKGYDDQPVKLLQDWATLDRRYGRIADRLRVNENWQPETLLPFEVPAVETAPTVTEENPPSGGLMGRIRK